MLECLILDYAGARWNSFIMNTHAHNFKLREDLYPLLQCDSNNKKDRILQNITSVGRIL